MGASVMYEECHDPLLQGTIPPKDPSSDFFLGRIKYKCTWLCLNMECKWVPLSCMKNVMVLAHKEQFVSDLMTNN